MTKIKKEQRFLIAFTGIVLIVMTIIFGFTFGMLCLWGFAFSAWVVWWVKHKVMTMLYVLGLCSGLALMLLISTEFNSTVPEDVAIDYVLILGAGLNGKEISKRLEGRLEQGYTYLSQHPESKVVLSGGQGPDEEISEAKAMGLYLISKGIEKDRIIYEDASTSTLENFIYSKKIIEKTANLSESKVLIVTSDYHMYRAKMIAKTLGYQCYGLTSKNSFMVKINYVLRESLALVKDKLYLVSRSK